MPIRNPPGVVNTDPRFIGYIKKSGINSIPRSDRKFIPVSFPGASPFDGSILAMNSVNRNILSPLFRVSLNSPVYINIITSLSDGNLGILSTGGTDYILSTSLGLQSVVLPGGPSNTYYLYSWNNANYRPSLTGKIIAYVPSGVILENQPLNPFRLTFPGVSRNSIPYITGGSECNVLTPTFSLNAGDIVVLKCTSLSDGGNVGLANSNFTYNQYENPKSGWRNYSVPSTDFYFIYSWNSSTFRTSLNGSGIYVYKYSPKVVFPVSG